MRLLKRKVDIYSIIILVACNVEVVGILLSRYLACCVCIYGFAIFYFLLAKLRCSNLNEIGLLQVQNLRYQMAQPVGNNYQTMSQYQPGTISQSRSVVPSMYPNSQSSSQRQYVPRIQPSK